MWRLLRNGADLVASKGGGGELEALVDRGVEDELGSDSSHYCM